jgi:hypothetical protein
LASFKAPPEVAFVEAVLGNDSAKALRRLLR